MPPAGRRARRHGQVNRLTLRDLLQFPRHPPPASLDGKGPRSAGVAAPYMEPEAPASPEPSVAHASKDSAEPTNCFPRHNGSRARNWEAAAAEITLCAFAGRVFGEAEKTPSRPNSPLPPNSPHPRA